MNINEQPKKDKEIYSEKHTLFIEEVPENRILVNKEKKYYKIEPKHKIFRVYIEEFYELKRGLHAVFNELKQAGKNDYLELRISSNGGFITEGQQFYNLIEENFNKRCVAYVDNHAYSMGALLFCMAEKRVVYPYSTLMFHNYSGGAFGKGNEIEAKIKHSSKTVKKFFKDIIVNKGFLSKKEFKEMLLGKDFWMDAKEMCKRKIATHVIQHGKTLTAKEYLKYLKKRKKHKKEAAKSNEILNKDL